MGKGDKPRNCFSKDFKNNYDEIDWRDKGTYCFDCGKTFGKDEKRDYYSDGQAKCLNGCNFN